MFRKRLSIMSRGYYKHLQSKETPWRDKVKLFRYAWRHDHVTFPNKEQALLDWVAYALLQCKGLEVEDAAAVWQCFYDVLHTRKCVALQKTGQQSTVLTLKSNVAEVLLKEIDALTNTSKTSATTSADVILICCHKVLTSPNFVFIFKSSLVKLLQLCTSLLQVCLDRCFRSRPEVNTTAILDLLETVLHRCLDAIQHAANRFHMMLKCEKLILPAVLFLQSPHASTLPPLESTKYNSCAANLWSAINQIYFCKDLRMKYKENSSKPGFIETLFKILARGLSGTAEEQEAVLRFLPPLYRAFLTSACGREREMAFEMLLHILNDCLGIQVISDVTATPQLHQQNLGGVLRCMCSLLHVVLDCDVYDVADDNAGEQVLLKWFRLLSAWLMSLDTRCGEWYDCFTVLLKLNPAVIEPELASLLEKTLVPVSQEGKDSGTASRNAFFKSLVQLYQKLSQIPKFVGKLLHVIKTKKDISNDCPYVLPTALLNSLGESISSLAVSSQLTLWETLVQQGEEQVQEQVQGQVQEQVQGQVQEQVQVDKQASHYTPALIDLMCTFLHYAKVADFNLAQAQSVRVEELMAQTWSRCCVRCVHACVTNKQSEAGLVSCLGLLYEWGELHLLLKQYAKYSGPQSEENVKKQGSIFSTHVFPPCQAIHRFEKMVNKMDSANVAYIKMKLKYQGVVARIVLNGGNQSDLSSHVQNATDDVIGRFADWSYSEISWSGQPRDVTDENLNVALWSHLLNTLYFRLPYLVENQLEGVARVLVTSVIGQEVDQSLTGSACRVTVSRLSAEFLRTDQFTESAALHVSLLHTVWTSLEHTVALKAKSPKKKKKSAFDQIARVFANLCDSKSRETNVKDINALLRQNDRVEKLISSSKIQTVQRHFQLLNALPLEYLPTELATDTFLASLTALFLLTPDQDQQPAVTALATTCFTMMRVILDGLKTGPVYEALDLPALLSWLLEFMQGFSSQAAESVMGGYMFLVSHILKHVTAHPDKITSLHTVVRKVCKGMRESANDVMLSTGLLLLQVLTRTKDEVTKATQTSINELTTLFLSMVENPSSCDSAAFSNIIGAYKVILLYQKKSNKSDVETSVLAHLPSMCDQCLDKLTNTKVVKIALSCLRFICNVCSNKWLNLTSQHFKDNCLQTLMNSCNQPVSHQITSAQDINIEGKVHQESFSEHRALQVLWQTFLPECKNISELTNQNVPNLNSTNEIAEQPEEDMDVDSEEKKSITKEKSDTLGNSIVKSQNLQEEKEDELRNELLRTIATFMSACDETTFQDNLQTLAASLVPLKVSAQPGRVIRTLRIVQQLMKHELSSTQWQHFGIFVHKIVPQVHRLVSDNTGGSALAVSEASLRLIVCLLTQGKMLLNRQLVTSCFQVCFTAPLLDQSLPLPRYVTMYQAVYDVINAVLVQHGKTVLGCVPTFVAAVKLLMVSIIRRGTQQTPPLAAEEEKSLERCAHLVERLLEVMGREKQFSKVAAYIVSDYVSAAQTVTLLPPVKKTLELGLYEILDLCDEHAVAQLHAVLSGASRQIFSAIYGNYKKYHKYTGGTRS